MTINELRNDIMSEKTRSAWSKGVVTYALELTETIEEGINGGWIEPDVFDSHSLLRKALLNGASNWTDYSYGGCALIYDEDIAKRLCTPSELKKTKNGQRNPNSTENWLDVQARALRQASRLILNIAAYHYLHC